MGCPFLSFLQEAKPAAAVEALKATKGFVRVYHTRYREKKDKMDIPRRPLTAYMLFAQVHVRAGGARGGGEIRLWVFSCPKNPHPPTQPLTHCTDLCGPPPTVGMRASGSSPHRPALGPL